MIDLEIKITILTVIILAIFYLGVAVAMKGHACLGIIIIVADIIFGVFISERL